MRKVVAKRITLNLIKAEKVDVNVKTANGWITKKKVFNTVSRVVKSLDDEARFLNMYTDNIKKQSESFLGTSGKYALKA